VKLNQQNVGAFFCFVVKQTKRLSKQKGGRFSGIRLTMAKSCSFPRENQQQTPIVKFVTWSQKTKKTFFAKNSDKTFVLQL
jgi:hypothetical protein